MEFVISSEKYNNIRAGNIGLSGEYLSNTSDLRINVNMTGNNTYLSVTLSGINFKPVLVHVIKNYDSIELVPIDKNPCGSITIKPTYNGWFNCVTWHTVLILDNVEPLYKLISDMVKFHDAAMIKAYFMVWMQHPALCPVKEISDLINELEGLDATAINWNEIVKSYLDD